MFERCFLGIVLAVLAVTFVLLQRLSRAPFGRVLRAIRGGGARINDTVVESETRAVSLADFDPAGIIKLSAGRKRHALLRPV